VTELLVVAGEPSGDRAGARVLAELGPTVRSFGIGGPALEAMGLDIVAHVSHLTTMGVSEVASRALRIAGELLRVARLAKKRRPAAALLIGYSDFNARLAPILRQRGTRVLWYSPPQVWAWRAHRVAKIKESVDALAVILPFEEAFWRARGAPARYVGHPVVEVKPLSRADARAALGLTPAASAIAILPGSRPHEVRRLLQPMLAAYETVRRDRASVDARLLLAPGLDQSTRDFAIAAARRERLACADVDPLSGAYQYLSAFDAALCASGTASLEAALARAMPVVAYRVGLLTEMVVRPKLSTPHIGLPNILLGRAVFPELLQRDVAERPLARALARVLDARAALTAACEELDVILRPPDGAPSPSRAVAGMLEAWL
jgi:lipid-A-disaccharide synthase